MDKRLDHILGILSDGHKASVKELAERLNVSPATIRQDLTRLEQDGFLKRFHGGAVLDETDVISHRMAINYDIKKKIAAKAASFINEGDTIFLESGSIMALLVKEIAALKNITIITSNAFIARSVAQNAENNVVLIGGVFQPESESLVGKMAVLCIEQLHFSKAFIGVDGFTGDTGFTGRDMMRAEIASTIIKKSPEVFIITDSSKFGRINLSRYCTLDETDHIITDSTIPDSFREMVSKESDLIIIDE
ncbi:MAG: DeoR/GlpR transcriptional regulator [Spirochaetales bacterium]|nr:DeoR/GlpR transcriptional regulator [Spirochaetales bacterium]